MAMNPDKLSVRGDKLIKAGTVAALLDLFIPGATHGALDLAGFSRLDNARGVLLVGGLDMALSLSLLVAGALVKRRANQLRRTS